MTCHGYRNGCLCAKCNARWRNHNTTGIRDKEVRQFITKELTPHGWRRIDFSGGSGGGGHPVFWHPEHSKDEDDVVTLPSTPSGRSWSKRCLADARRIHPGMPRPTSRSKTTTPVVADIGPTREQRLIEHASTLGIELTQQQAEAILASHGRMKDARAFLNRLVAAKRRTIVA